MSTSPCPFRRAALLLATPALLWFAGCTAEAAGKRPDILLVSEHSEALRAVVGRIHDAGYRTAVTGWFPEALDGAGVDARCVWLPGHGPRLWGPFVQWNDQATTLPDDVFAPRLFAEFLARFAAAADRPFLACVVVPAADPAASPDLTWRAMAARLEEEFTTRGGRPVLLLATGRTDGDETVQLLATWLGRNAPDAPPLEQRARPEDVAPTLLELTGSARDGVAGTSFAGAVRRRAGHGS